jgi:hypothetical protein
LTIPLYRFHCSVHARPADAASGDPARLRDQIFSTIRVESAALGVPFTVSFEQAADALARLPRMYCEPDGSFVWVSGTDEPQSWQVDGVLYDRAGRLLHVDLKGECPADRFDQLLGAFGWPESEIIFQLAREAVFLDEPEFRRWAGEDVE